MTRTDVMHSSHQGGYSSTRRIQSYAITDCGRVVEDLADRVTWDTRKVTCPKCIAKSDAKVAAARAKRREENKELAGVDRYPWGSSAKIRALVKKGLLERDDESWRPHRRRRPRYRLTPEGLKRLEDQRREDLLGERTLGSEA